MNYNKINKKIKYKNVVKFKKYNIHGNDYLIKFDNFMEYDEIKKKLATLTILAE